MRFAKSEFILANHLTNDRSSSQLYEALKEYTLKRINKYDSGSVTESVIRDAAIDIPLLGYGKNLKVDVEQINEQIVSMSNNLSESTHTEITRMPSTGRKSLAPIESQN